MLVTPGSEVGWEVKPVDARAVMVEGTATEVVGMVEGTGREVGKDKGGGESIHIGVGDSFL